MALKTGFQNGYKFNPFAADLHNEKNHILRSNFSRIFRPISEQLKYFGATLSGRSILCWCEYESDLRNYEHYLSSSEKKAWRKFRPVRDLNPWPLRYRCSALLHLYSFHYCLRSVHNCEDRFHIHVFIRSSNIWLSYIHNRLLCWWSMSVPEQLFTHSSPNPTLPNLFTLEYCWTPITFHHYRIT